MLHCLLKSVRAFARVCLDRQRQNIYIYIYIYIYVYGGIQVKELEHAAIAPLVRPLLRLY
jgi:hypothetical protein